MLFVKIFGRLLNLWHLDWLTMNFSDVIVISLSNSHSIGRLQGGVHSQGLQSGPCTKSIGSPSYFCLNNLKEHRNNLQNRFLNFTRLY